METTGTYGGRRLTFQRELEGLKQKEALWCRRLPSSEEHQTRTPEELKCIIHAIDAHAGQGRAEKA